MLYFCRWRTKLIKHNLEQCWALHWQLLEDSYRKFELKPLMECLNNVVPYMVCLFVIQLCLSWFDLIGPVIEYLFEHNRGYQINVVKERFAHCLFYYDTFIFALACHVSYYSHQTISFFDVCTQHGNKFFNQVVPNSVCMKDDVRHSNAEVFHDELLLVKCAKRFNDIHEVVFEWHHYLLRSLVCSYWCRLQGHKVYLQFVLENIRCMEVLALRKVRCLQYLKHCLPCLWYLWKLGK